MKKGYLLSIFTFACLLMAYSSCNRSAAELPGKELSKIYCVSCHAYPEPSLLPKHIWDKRVLPVMAAFADLYKDKNGVYKKIPKEYLNLRDPAIEPVHANIPSSSWNKIVEFYLDQAPVKLESPVTAIDTLNHFAVLEAPKKRAKSFTTCVYFDASSKLLFQSNYADKVLNIFDEKLNFKTSLPFCEGVVNVCPIGNQSDGDHFLITHIGSLQPNGATANGFVEEVTIKKSKIVGRVKRCDSLYRPVQALFCDVDKDGRKDIIVCEFGFMKGQLSLFKNTGINKYKKITLSNIVGAEKIYIDDINNDGMPDIWALFAHDIEGIYQFINEGNGRFVQKPVINFPPSYGSSSFDIVDMDNDGKNDIVYTSGDNADFSPVLKPYHGIYIYKNMGSDFKQKFFLHLNGCYKAMPADFNGDGRMDLAAISFSADFENNPKEGFVWLLNQGNNHFNTFTDSRTIGLGRWICMDVADINRDGKPDVILGNMAAIANNNRELMQKWLKGPELIVLKTKP